MDVEALKRIAVDFAATQPGWSVPRYINAGASGAVFELQHPAHGQVALKLYDPRFFQGANALIEQDRLRLQAQLTGQHHPNLITTIETAPVPGHGTWFLLMDFLPWPDLSEVVADVPDDRVGALIAQLASAVLFLRERGLVHRDIKPANIGVSPDWSTLKLLDLGVLRAIGVEEGAGTDRDGQERFVATAQYSPPEYLAREEPPGEQGFDALNVYQVGAVLHDLIMKRPLFGEEAASLVKLRLYRAVLNDQPVIASAGVPPRLASLCRSALDKDPERRLAAVSVDDFSRAADDAEQVRRRLANRAMPPSAMPAPSVMTWRARVADWLAAAAGAERAALGALEMRATVADAPAWSLHFSNGGVLLARLEVDDRAGVLRLVLGGEGPARTALEIDGNGPTTAAPQIVPQLREHILFALDDTGARANGTAE